MHALPIFEGSNGTVFLDFTASTHKCHADGGWQDFFDLGNHAVPWSAQKEAAGGEVCAKYFLGTIDDVVHETGLGWTELMEISIKRIWKYQPRMKTQQLHVIRSLDAAEKPTIAIHVKAAGGTPVQKHLALPAQEYVSLFVKTFPHVKGGTCIIAGGDEAVNAETADLAAQQIGCKAFNRTAVHHQPGDPAVVPHGSLQAHCLLTRNLLFDLELLAHTDYFVGTTKSGLSPLIETLRYALYGKDRRTFVTHGGDWYERIREYFHVGHPALNV
ncbi:g3651 [Coccomyxa elongata]